MVFCIMTNNCPRKFSKHILYNWTPHHEMIVVFFNLVHTLFQKRLAMHGLCINTLWMMMMNCRQEIYINNNTKNTIKNPIAKTITWKTKGRPKKGQKTPTRTKEGRASPSCGRNNS